MPGASGMKNLTIASQRSFTSFQTEKRRTRGDCCGVARCEQTEECDACSDGRSHSIRHNHCSPLLFSKDWNAPPAMPQTDAAKGRMRSWSETARHAMNRCHLGHRFARFEKCSQSPLNRRDRPHGRTMPLGNGRPEILRLTFSIPVKRICHPFKLLSWLDEIAYRSD